MKSNWYNKYSKKGYEKLYAPFYYVGKYPLMWLILAASAYFSLSFYENLFVNLPYSGNLAIVATVSISLLIGYLFNHCFTVWFMEGGGPDAFAIVLVCCLGWNYYTDWYGSEAVADNKHEQIDSKIVTSVDDPFKISFEALRQQIKEQDKIIEANKDWAAGGKGKENWRKYNLWKAALKLKPKYEGQLNELSLKFSDNKGKSLSIYEKEYKKREERVQVTEERFKGVVSLCMVLAILISYNVHKYEKKCVELSQKVEVHDSQTIERQLSRQKTDKKPMVSGDMHDILGDVERQLSGFNEVEQEIMRLLNETDLSYRKIAERLQEYGVTKDKVYLINKEFDIRK